MIKEIIKYLKENPISIILIDILYLIGVFILTYSAITFGAIIFE